MPVYPIVPIVGARLTRVMEDTIAAIHFRSINGNLDLRIFRLFRSNIRLYIRGDLV